MQKKFSKMAVWAFILSVIAVLIPMIGVLVFSTIIQPITSPDQAIINLAITGPLKIAFLILTLIIFPPIIILSLILAISALIAIKRKSLRGSGLAITALIIDILGGPVSQFLSKKFLG